MSKTYSFLGEILKEARIKKNLRLKDVASAIDIDISTLAKIEKNQRNPNNALIIKIAQVLELDKSQLRKNLISDKLVYQINNEDDPKEILRLAEEKIDYIRKNK